MVVFEGKSAIVTGASRGIGRATARRLASAGCAVFLAADGPAEDLEAAAAECRKAGKVRAEWGLFDLAKLGESEAMVKAALECFRKVDILVNNAGVRADKLLGEFTHKDFDYVVGGKPSGALFCQPSRSSFHAGRRWRGASSTLRVNSASSRQRRRLYTE